MKGIALKRHRRIEGADTADYVVTRFVYHNQMIQDDYGEYGQDESASLGLGQNSVSHKPRYIYALERQRRIKW